MDGKLCIAPHAPCGIYICVCVCVCVCASYDRNPESAWKILRTQLEKKSHLGKPAIVTLDSSMMGKMAAESKAKGKKPGSTCGLLD